MVLSLQHKWFNTHTLSSPDWILKTSHKNVAHINKLRVCIYMCVCVSAFTVYPHIFFFSLVVSVSDSFCHSYAQINKKKKWILLCIRLFLVPESESSMKKTKADTHRKLHTSAYTFIAVWVMHYRQNSLALTTKAGEKQCWIKQLNE